MYYTILSVGRTGGTLIAKNLRRLNLNKDKCSVEHQPLMLHKENLDYPVVSHVPTAQTKNNTPVLSKRRCIYNSVLSVAIMNHTHESHQYTTDWDTQSFILPKDTFISTYLYFLEFYNRIDLSVYDCAPVTVYYEDMINDPLYLFKQFGIELKTDYSLCTQSPPSHHMISNLNELKEMCCKQRWATE